MSVKSDGAYPASEPLIIHLFQMSVKRIHSIPMGPTPHRNPGSFTFLFGLDGNILIKPETHPI